MVLSDEKKRAYQRRILLSRMRLLVKNGFYGLLLMHMGFALDDACATAATDGRRIVFGPSFLEELSDSELDFVMMHEILHVVLQHCFRSGDCDGERFNVACDIVVNSNILRSNNMDHRAITLRRYGVSMHLAPDGKEGCEYTAEEVYAMLPPGRSRTQPRKSGGLSGNSLGRAKKTQGERCDRTDGWDDHTYWGMTEEDDTIRDVWVKHFEDACAAISVRDPSNTRGLLPLFAERLYGRLRRPQTDWRMILNDFVQEELSDYSFSPPDRRFAESPFFLPDFSDKDSVVEDVLFMIDTSGSMSDDMIAAAYSEIKGAIDQFGGKLRGWLGFFDAAIIAPKPFTSEAAFRVIKPAGGGGTDFQIIFEYVRLHMRDKLPASIIILTDGFAPYPKESLSMGIPVLWLLNNEESDPPWGRVARITV